MKPAINAPNFVSQFCHWLSLLRHSVVTKCRLRGGGSFNYRSERLSVNVLVITELLELNNSGGGGGGGAIDTPTFTPKILSFRHGF